MVRLVLNISSSECKSSKPWISVAFRPVSMVALARLFFLFCCLLGNVNSVAVNFPGTTVCQDDQLQVELPEELSNSTFWQLELLDTSGEGIEDCDYKVDDEKQTLTVLYMNCTTLENHKHHLRLRLQFNDTVTRDIQNVTYDVACDALQADEAARRGRFASATNCTKDFMAVVFPRLIPSFHDEHAAAESRMEWILSVEDGTQTRKLSLRQAMQQGYNFLMDGNRVIIQVSFDAAGVAAYKQDGQVLYTVALKLTYGSPEQRLTVESRMICAPGPAICNATHMTIAIPDFTGFLSAVSLDNRNIPVSQFEANGIQMDTRKGIKLHMNKDILRSRVYEDDYCSGFQLYAPLLKLYFGYHGETVTMSIYPECPCEQNAPIAAVCTPDGYMDFEILSSSTKPALNLDLLRLKDPSCKPVFQSPSNDVVRFHVPLNGCGTRQRFDGGKAIYENEVTATWMDLPARWISRDSEFKLTVICYYGSDDAALDIKIGNLSPPDSVVNQGPLSLILLIYPDSSYMVPYSDDQYPIVKYLRQPIFIEVQVLNRVDPNIQLMLDDCWASLSLDPASLPRWNIVVDGCEYEQDNYRTVFHPVDTTVSYYNFRQRFEVKAFAFVSDGKALPSLVYFHCSVLICNRFHPDSPLCSSSCPRRPSRGRREVAPAASSAIVTLPHAVILVPQEEYETRGQQEWSDGDWLTSMQVAGVMLALLSAGLAVLALSKIKKRTLLIN